MILLNHLSIPFLCSFHFLVNSITSYQTDPKRFLVDYDGGFWNPNWQRFCSLVSNLWGFWNQFDMQCTLASDLGGFWNPSSTRIMMFAVTLWVTWRKNEGILEMMVVVFEFILVVSGTSEKETAWWWWWWFKYGRNWWLRYIRIHGASIGETGMVAPRVLQFPSHACL